MKISKQTNKKKPFTKTLLCLSLVVLVIIGLSVYTYALHGSLFGWQPSPPQNSNSSTNTSPSKSGNESSPEKGVKDGTNEDKTTDEVPVDSTITSSITDLYQSNGYVYFMGSTNDTRGGGKCSVTFTNTNDHPVSRTADAGLSNGTAQCGPIQIPETEFSFIGDWVATFRYYVNGVQAVAEKTITIK